MTKNFQVEIARRAEQDVQRNCDFIARDKPRAAEKWMREVARKIRSLKSHPLRCEVIPEPFDTDVEYRHLLFGNYRIVFRVEGNRVVVVRVFHAARILDMNHLIDFA